VYVARTPREKAMQRALLQFDQKRNWPLIREALREAGREDLIGPGGLVPDEGAEYRKAPKSGGKTAAAGKPAKNGAKNAARSRAERSKSGDMPKGVSRKGKAGSGKGAADEKSEAGRTGGRKKAHADGIKAKKGSGKEAGR